MLPKKVKQRASLLIIFFVLTVLAIFLILRSLNKNILYFKSPTYIKVSQDINFDEKIRVGGMVKENSIQINDKEIFFVITDYKNELLVTFNVSIPNLFEEGKGVVAEGTLKDRNFLNAVKILANHDENYMPPEVSEALKQN